MKKIKFISLLCILLFISIPNLVSKEDNIQNPITKYTYDSHGNCISRNTIVLKRVVDSTKQGDEKPKIYEDTKINLKIYPNPTFGQLNIEIPDYIGKGDLSISIYDLSGKLYTNKRGNESSINMDLSNYPNGTYILRISRNGKYSSWKIIKK